jgi:hypothetical protein
MEIKLMMIIGCPDAKVLSLLDTDNNAEWFPRKEI